MPLEDSRASPPIFSDSPTSITTVTDGLIAEYQALCGSLTSRITPSTATFDNIVLPVVYHENVYLHTRHKLEFYQHVSTAPEIRDASRTAAERFAALDTELAQSVDMYRLVLAVKDKNEDLDVECMRLLNRRLETYERNGLQLPSTSRTKLKEIQVELEKIRTTFDKNLAEDTGGVWLTRDELKGVSEADLEDLEEDKTTGKLRVTSRPALVGSILSDAHSDETRKIVWLGREQSGEKNVPLIERALALRHQAATLHGSKNHAEWKLGDKMEKSVSRVNSFLENLKVRLIPKGEEELAAMKGLKKDDLIARGKEIEDDGRFYPWDNGYYSRLFSEREFRTDNKAVEKYLPLDQTVATVLKVYERLLGLKFEAMPTTDTPKGPVVWHKDVQMFAVWDDSNGQSGKVEEKDASGSKPFFIGYLYMDLLPRPGKFAHYADFNIHSGYTGPSGTSIRPATCLVTSFPPTLSHQNLWTLLHELGHGIHDLVGASRFALFFGAETAQDFNEAPSQLLEHFAWQPEILQMFGIPEELSKKLIKARFDVRPGFLLTCLQYSLFDMEIHQQEGMVDTTEAWNRVRKELRPGIEGYTGCGQGNFGHLFRGYDAGYYSYLSSQIYASDMFFSAFAADPLNRSQGLRYRRMILEKGGSEDEMEMMKKFLGRRPNSDAFYKLLGL